jgi:hypothetical protein
MKNASIVAFAGFVFAAHISQAQSPPVSVSQAVEDYTVVQIGPNSRVWQNPAGQSVTEIGTGMNFWDGQKWAPSDPSFVASPDGKSFVAAQIQHPTRLAVDLRCEGAVTVTTPENLTLRSTPLAIGLYDPESGRSVIVATLTNTTGVLADAQDVVYDRAFVGGGFAASVVYSLPDVGSFHQDVVFVGFDKGFNPTNWGFAESSTNQLQIQVITEFYDPPQPRMLPHLIYSEQDQVKRGRMASPDLFDHALDFGHYVFGPGRAYTTATNDNYHGGSGVMKDFVTTGGRTFLVESVPYVRLVGELESLPPVVTKTSSLTPPPTARRAKLAVASLPQLRGIKLGTVENAVPGKDIAFAPSKPHGVVVDYVVTVSSTVEPTIFAADTTYFVSGNVTCSSATTMESAVFKYPTNSVYISINSTLTMATTNYRPAIFTAADDNTSGTTLSTSIWSHYTGNPGTNYYGQYSLYFNSTGNYALNNLRFSYQNCAIYSDNASSVQVLSISHAQMVDCDVGFSVLGNNSGGGGGAILPPNGESSLKLNVNNCLMAQVLYPFEADNDALTVNPCNCTIDSCTKLVNNSGTTSGTFNFTNSILSSVSSEGTLGSMTVGGSFNGFSNSPTFGSSTITATSNPFQPVGAGNYYQTNTSPFLTNATTNIPSTLLAQLEMKTIQAPLILSNSFITNTELAPVSQRDTTRSALGFHYDPIDFISACDVSNATLLLTNGVVLGYYDDLGIWLQDNSQLVSQGAPNYRNYLVYYGLVQEQPVNLWGVTNAVAQSLPIAPIPFNSANKPSVFLRLTTICAPQGETNLLNTADSNQVVSAITLRDCEIYGAGANWIMSESNNAPLIGMTNNVFHRVPFAVSNNATMLCYNNLFYGTTNTNGFTVSIRHRAGSSSPNTNENNVFDGVTAVLDGTNNYNAYIHGGTNSNGSTNSSDLWTNLTWQAGPLGAYYQATNSPLLTNGSTYATNLGLYHYTMITNEVVEGSNIVSRGYHYVALGTNGLPLDTSGDGIPDYLADANGNNSGGTGAWSNYVSPNGLLTPSGLTVFTPLK